MGGFQLAQIEEDQTDVKPLGRAAFVAELLGV
jgi:hypothetical protein